MKNVPNNDLSTRRLQLFAAGYLPIPNRGKVPGATGWNSKQFAETEYQPFKRKSAEERIARWARVFPDAQSTGVRVEGGLGVIDIDVDDEAIVAGLFGAMPPEIADKAPARFGGGAHKVALFVRVTEGEAPYIRLASHKYRRPGEDGAGHGIEIFGGAPTLTGKASRQFGVYGPHSYDEAGNVLREYEWAEPALHEVPRPALPALTREQAGLLIDRFEALAAAAGWERITQAHDGEDGGHLFDIVVEGEERTRFDVQNGPDQIDYDELCELHSGRGSNLRVSSSWLPDRGTNRGKLWAFWSARHDCLGLYDFETLTTHYPVGLAPQRDEEREALYEELRRRAAAPPPAPADRVTKGFAGEMPPRPRNMTMEEQNTECAESGRLVGERADWLVKTHSSEAGKVANIYTGEVLTESAARFQLLNWRMNRAGPRGGATAPLTAFATWGTAEGRLETAGAQLRPDMPFPLFEERGRLWRNSFARPVWPQAAPETVRRARDMFGLLCGNVASGPGEREFLLDSAAYKWRNPEVPGCGILFVSPAQGSGRNTLFEIMGRLFGGRHVLVQEASVVLGTSSQSAYNDWITNNVMIFISEIYDPEATRAAYERLKTLIDPAVRTNLATRGKYKPGSEEGRSFATVWMATNHTDALRIDENDRRLSVLLGRGRLSVADATAIRAWMAEPDSMAGLAALLEARDLSTFNPREALETATKRATIEGTRDPVEQALLDLRDNADRTWSVFTREQLDTLITQQMGLTSNSRPDKTRNLSQRLRSACAGRVTPVLNPWGGQRRPRIDGKQERVFCFTDDAARTSNMSDDEIRANLPGSPFVNLGNVVQMKPRKD